MTGALEPHTPAALHRLWPPCRRCYGIALDMGSARTRALIAGRGAVVDVPTVASPGRVTSRPIRRGMIVDTEGCSRMLERLLAERLPQRVRPMVIVAAPVLDGLAYRAQARTAVGVLRPRSVLTVPGARGVALAAGADTSQPLLVLDIGAHLTEVVLLCDGAVTDAHTTALGTSDLDEDTAPEQLADAVARMLTAMLRQDRSSVTVEALHRGVLVAGGGALRPQVMYHLTGRLCAPLRVVPAPHTAAVRGAAKLLHAAHAHPSACGPRPREPHLN